MELALQLLINGVILGAFYALLSLSISLIYATTSTFHFAHGATFAISAYVAALTATGLGLPWPVACLLGIIAGGLLGAGWELVAYRPLRKAGATPMSIFIVSLAITIILPSVILLVIGGRNVTLPVDTVPMQFPLSAGVSVSSFDLIKFFVSAGCVVLVLVLRRVTKYGRAATAVQTNPTMAAAVGVMPSRIFVLVFVVGSALMGVAAQLFLLTGTASPTMGLQYVLYGFIGMFLGGVGSHLRAALGGFALGVVSSVSGLWLSADLSQVAVFAVLFIVLIIRPRGLFARFAASR